MLHYSQIFRKNLISSFFLKNKSNINRTQIMQRVCKRYSTMNNVETTEEENPKHLDWTDRLINRAPLSVQPYLKLVRLDMPIGNLVIFWPVAWSVAAAAAPGCLPDIPMLLFLGTAVFVMRGVGCTINDMWDRDFDKNVSRTKNRPLASGSISMKQSSIFLAGQLTVGALLISQLNTCSIILSTSSIFLIITYPLMKRITYWPQVMLGLTANWGSILGYSAIHGIVNLPVCIPLYLSGICWSVVYDTMYAHQDRKDDLKAGVKSTAIKFGENTKLYLSLFSVGMLSNLILFGIINLESWPYYGAISLLGFHLARQITTLDINNPTNCYSKFQSVIHGGFLLFCGIVLGNLLKQDNTNESIIQNLE